MHARVLRYAIAFALMATPSVAAQQSDAEQSAAEPAEDPTLHVRQLQDEVARLSEEWQRIRTRLEQQSSTGSPAPVSSAEMQQARITAALDSPTEIEFQEAPLADVAHYISKLHSIPVILDPRIMEAGFDRHFPLDIVVTNITLRSALDLMLAPHDLDYVVEDEVLKITTAEAAEEHRETHIYDVRHIQDLPAEELARVIRSTVRPRSWRDRSTPATAGGGGFGSGGFGSGGFGGPTASFDVPDRTAAIEPLGQFLVITQSQRGHREIATLLSELNRMQTSRPRDGSTGQAEDTTEPTDEFIPSGQDDEAGPN